MYTAARIIFLDIDGVLNSARSHQAFLYRTIGDALKEDTLKHGYVEALTRATLDPVGVDLINCLVRETKAKIVVSSSHRLLFRNDIDSVAEYMDKLGIIGEIIGVTPNLNNQPRGQEIHDWIIMSAYALESYVIFDDDADMLEEQLPHFIQTSWQDGLSMENYTRAIKILKGEDLKVQNQGTRY